VRSEQPGHEGQNAPDRLPAAVGQSVATGSGHGGPVQGHTFGE